MTEFRVEVKKKRNDLAVLHAQMVFDIMGDILRGPAPTDAGRSRSRSPRR